MVANDSAEKRLSGKMKMHIWLIIMWLIFWFWPGGLLFNSIEPHILGIPFNIIMWMLILPIIHIVHMVYCFRWRNAQDQAEAMALNVKQKSP